MLKTLEVAAQSENLPKVQEFVQSQLKENQSCSPDVLWKTELAIEEIFTNVANYAYPDKNGTVIISVDAQAAEDTAVISFTDHGVPYDPLKKADPNLQLSAQDRPIGGLGIFLTKKMMDNVAYKFENGANVLILTKKLKK
jgi:serine/threonine-protein kinase RsbW